MTETGGGSRVGSPGARLGALVAALVLVLVACSGASDTPGTASGSSAPGATTGATAGGTTAGTAPAPGSEADEDSEWIDGQYQDSDGNLAEPDAATATPGTPGTTTGASGGTSTSGTASAPSSLIPTTVTTPPPPTADATYAWTQLAPDGHLQVRAVVNGACPPIKVDGANQPMTTFAAPTTAFPYTTCQLDLATPASSIVLAGRSMPTMPTSLKRIVVVGDIGCYVKAKKQQNCLDPKKFPAQQVAQQIAAAKPDLVLFVGDVYYTESPCPTSAASKCAGVPSGDNWSSWAYNFFTPYASALGSAPWIFSRGNHENCSGKTDNGGAGWFQLLAVTASACQDITMPYRVDVAGQSFVVFDSALANDNPADASQVTSYTPAFAQVHQLVQGHPGAWFMDHRPMWATRGTKSSDTLNLTLEGANRAAGNTLASDVDLILSGHVHALGVYTLADGRPAQILSGGGGVKLTGSGGDFKGTAIDGTTFTKADVQTSWGYVQFDRPSSSTSSWTVTYQELGGSVWKTCTLSGRALSC